MEFTRCYGCMGELSKPGGVCPRCGYDNTEGPKAQPGHALPCGTVLAGHYVVGRALGQGGFGITYIGWNLSLNMPVCVKEYFPAGAAMRSSAQSGEVLWSAGESAEELRRGRESFVKEARKAVRLRDLSSVVMVWDVFYENDTAYIVMDYIEGETLKSRLVKSGRTLSAADCLALLRPVMLDLEKAHARGIIHRDIKPDNLMLDGEGAPTLLDLGAAKDLSGGSGQSSFLVASQGFSPMEQYASGGKIGPWTDVYALCATICWCVSGKLPPTPMNRVTGEEIDFSAFTPAFAEALKRGLALRPEDRIQSMGELLGALEAAVDPSKAAKNAPPRPSDSAASQPERSAPPRKKSGLPLLLGLAAVLALAAVFMLTRGKLSSPAVTETPAPTERAPVMTVATPEPTPEPSPIPTPDPTPEPTPEPMPKPTSPPVLEPISTGRTAAGLYYYEYDDHVRVSVQDSSGYVEIPREVKGKPVTEIGGRAWEYKAHSNLTGIAIPDSVTRIDSNAFLKCANLTNITIPDSVTDIGDSAFSGCASLTDIAVPNSVTSIGSSVFTNCTWLRSVSLPDNLTDIGSHMFSGCAYLRDITIPDTVTGIGHSAFADCASLRNINIPKAVATISNEAFYGCSMLESITLPDGITKIGYKMFYGCTMLGDITIPVSVTSVGKDAFKNCTTFRVHYAGTEAQWAAMDIAKGNEKLVGAIISFGAA